MGGSSRLGADRAPSSQTLGSTPSATSARRSRWPRHAGCTLGPRGRPAPRRGPRCHSRGRFRRADVQPHRRGAATAASSRPTIRDRSPRRALVTSRAHHRTARRCRAGGPPGLRGGGRLRNGTGRGAAHPLLKMPNALCTPTSATQRRKATGHLCRWRRTPARLGRRRPIDVINRRRWGGRRGDDGASVRSPDDVRPDA
jgi:hypothetical protein